MLSIIKNKQISKYGNTHSYSLYINETLKLEFEHFREPEDLATLLRDAADAVDLNNGITPANHIQKTPEPKKPTMMERMNGIKHHLEKQEMDY